MIRLNFVVAALLFCASCAGDRVVIGSKNFTEQIILGEILAQHIEMQTDLRVDRRFNLGGTFICHQALLAGQIDLYVEYSGTAHSAILKQEASRDPSRVLEEVEREYLLLGIETLPPLGFNNTFAILIRGEDARRLGLRTISEASRYTPEWRAGFGYEFMEREDGWAGLSAAYDLRFPAPPRVMELGLIYRALAEKRIDLTAGDATNGLIAVLDLAVLEDDRGYFPPYHALPLIRRRTLESYPFLRPVLEQLGGQISEPQMRELNYQVDGLQRQIKDVAAEFLSGLPGRDALPPRNSAGGMD